MVTGNYLMETRIFLIKVALNYMGLLYGQAFLIIKQENMEMKAGAQEVVLLCIIICQLTRMVQPDYSN